MAASDTGALARITTPEDLDDFLIHRPEWLSLNSLEYLHQQILANVIVRVDEAARRYDARGF